MKTLKKMRIVEKARLFHQLFKEQIPELLQSMEVTCQRVKEASPESRVWDGGLFGEKLSYTIVLETQQAIERYKRVMRTDSKIFADQLFDGNRAVFAVHSMRKCAFTDLAVNRRVHLAIDLFFNS